MVNSYFDIFNSTLRYVKCIRSDCEVYGTGGDYNHELTVGEKYFVEQVDVYNWYTLLTIKGFKNRFSSVLFTEIEE